MAEVQIQLAQAKAEAEAERLVASEVVRQEVERRKAEILAAADAEQARLRARGDADAVRARYEAEAEGLRKLLQSKADGYRALVESCAGDPRAAASLLMIEKIEKMVGAQVAAIKNLKIDKITVWDSGGNGQGGSSTANFAANLIKSLPPLHEVAKMAGVELPSPDGTRAQGDRASRKDAMLLCRCTKRVGAYRTRRPSDHVAACWPSGLRATCPAMRAENQSSSARGSTAGVGAAPLQTNLCPSCGADRASVALDGARDYEYGVPGAFRFDRCSECSLVFLAPRPSPAEILSYYPAEYHAYQRPTSRLFRLLNQAQFKPRVRKYQQRLPERGRVLDVGCGDGSLLREIGRRGPWELYGLDFNATAIPADSTPGSRPIHYYAGILETAPYEPGSFDLIVMHHLLEHVPEPKATLAKALELLRPGGWLLGQLPNYDSIERQLTGRWWNGFHTPRHMQCFTPDTLVGLLQRVGFDQVRTASAMHPGQWALSLQSYVADQWLPSSQVHHGKAWFYPACLLAAVPLVAAEVVFDRAGIMDFEAQKPPVVG